MHSVCFVKQRTAYEMRISDWSSDVCSSDLAALMTPVTLALAAELGVDPRPLVIALMIGASACFATPIGYQTNTIVYAAGDYRFVDFVKIGVPLNIITGVSTCLAIVFFLT